MSATELQNRLAEKADSIVGKPVIEVRNLDAHRRFARATGTAVSQGFRAASPVARDAPHRHATRSLPKTLGSRLYESLLRTFGITWQA